MSDSDYRTKRFMMLFTQYQRHVYYFIRSMVPDPADAEEILQQTNLVLWEKFDEFSAGSNFRAWACSIARFEVFNYRARQNKEQQRFSDTFLDQVAAAADRNADVLESQTNALHFCLDRLESKDREMIQRRYQPGMTSSKLADELGRPIRSVYKSLSRVRRALVECVRRRQVESEEPT